MATQSMQTKSTMYQQLIAGLQKNAPNLVLLLASESYTTAQVVTTLQSLLTAADLAVSSKTTWHDAVVASDKLETQYAPLVAELKQAIALMFSNAETTLAQFGLTAKKARKPLTTEQLATRAAKAKATRAARGTLGKAKKAAISGNVTGVTIVPVTASGGTTAIPASAPSATPGAAAAPAISGAAGSAVATPAPAVSTAPTSAGSGITGTSGGAAAPAAPAGAVAHS